MSAPYTCVLASDPELFGPNAPETPSNSVCVSVRSNDVAARGTMSKSPGPRTARWVVTPPWISDDSSERKLNAVPPALLKTLSMVSRYHEVGASQDSLAP